MMSDRNESGHAAAHGLKPSRRAALAGGAALAGLAALPGRARADTVTLPFANGERPIVPAGTFPQKGEMILQRTRPPLLETPFAVFRDHLYTPNDLTFVRWHLGDVPTSVDPATYRLRIGGAVKRPYELTLEELVRGFTHRRMAAVNQCAGNSRGLIEPRVAGAQWGNGAMFNAIWTGVPLRALLARAGVSPKATHVAFRSLESGGIFPPDAQFEKALPIRRANDGVTMVAFRMNGAYLPLLNGYPVRLVVPGWFSTYWMKMLTEIEVLEYPSTDFWMAKAYRIPDRPDGGMRPGEAGVPMVPIGPMRPRSFFTSVTDGTRLPTPGAVTLRGFGFGGRTALRAITVSIDGGKNWRAATLGPDHGPYGFREWHAVTRFPKAGDYRLMVRASNAAGDTQPMRAVWNPGGYLYNPVERVDVMVG